MGTVIVAHQFRSAQYAIAPYGTRQSSANYSALLLCQHRHWDARNLHVDRAQLVPAGKVEGFPVGAAEADIGRGGICSFLSSAEDRPVFRYSPGPQIRQKPEGRGE